MQGLYRHSLLLFLPSILPITMNQSLLIVIFVYAQSILYTSQESSYISFIGWELFDIIVEIYVDTRTVIRSMILRILASACMTLVGPSVIKLVWLHCFVVHLFCTYANLLKNIMTRSLFLLIRLVDRSPTKTPLEIL